MDGVCLLDLTITTNLFIYLWFNGLLNENEKVMGHVLPVTCHARTHAQRGSTDTALLILLTSTPDGMGGQRHAPADLPPPRVHSPGTDCRRRWVGKRVSKRENDSPPPEFQP